MRTKMVKAIFKKEMIDILRDKKTLFMGIILPLILYPVIMIVMTQKNLRKMLENFYKL